MDKGTVVFIRCTFKRGGFPSERVFAIQAQSGVVRGVADVRYCYTRQDSTPLGDEPTNHQEIEGQLLGLVVRKPENETVRVHLPDGEVYDLDKTNIVPARGETRRVPVQS